ncbi:MAG: hypothetical protein AAF639_11945 [Chloroflexota bacterium]
MNTNIVRMLGGVTIVGAILWLMSEVVERSNGGISNLSMGMLVVALFLLAVGVWGVHAVQRMQTGWLGLVGAIGISIGSFLLGIVDIMGFGLTTIAEVIANAGIVYFIAVFAVVIGSIAFGIAVFRAGVFARWTGILTVVSTLITLAVEILALPEIGISIANVFLNVALIAMGWQAINS